MANNIETSICRYADTDYQKILAGAKDRDISRKTGMVKVITTQNIGVYHFSLKEGDTTVCFERWNGNWEGKIVGNKDANYVTHITLAEIIEKS